MTCFTQQKKLRIRQRDKRIDEGLIAAKPVHPESLRSHGLFGKTFVRQHMMADERWTPNSLGEQFGCISALLERRMIYKRYEANSNRQRYLREIEQLKMQCRDGRSKLQNILKKNNALKIRNILIKHKDI